MICFSAVVLICVLTADPVQVEGENVKINAFHLVVGPMPVQDMRTKKTLPTRDRYLQCALSVTNKSSDKNLEFRGWASNPSAAAAFLKDDLGHEYKLADLGATSQYSGKIKTLSVSPGKGAVELLLFEIPRAKASSFTLTLKGKNVGEERDLVIQFPRDAINDPFGGGMTGAKGRKVLAGAQEDRNPTAAGPAAEQPRQQESLEKARWRVWISADGKYKTEAKFLRAEAGKIVLQKNDGTEIVVAEGKLSTEDVDWVQSEKWKASP
jgi:hypothetical protein